MTHSTDGDRACLSNSVRHWILALVILGAGVTFTRHLVTLSRPLNASHAWGSADAALSARSFNNSGVIALRGVPFPNNPPFGTHVEPYVHWPPLFPIALSFVFRLFGESEASMHGFMLLIEAITAALIYFLIRAGMGTIAAAFGLLAWLSLPVVLEYSDAVMPTHPMILFLVLALLAFHYATDGARHRSAWVAAGAAAVSFSVLCSWEGVLLPLGLLAGSRWTRDREQRRVALIFLASGVLAAVAVFAWFALAYPDLTRDTLVTALYRMGLSDVNSTTLYHLNKRETNPYIPLTMRATIIAALLVATLRGVSLLAIAACTCRYLDRSGSSAGDRSVTLFAGLLFTPLIWFTVFSNHAANHEFEYLLAAPAAAWALGWSADACLRFLAAPPRMKVSMGALAVIGPLVLLTPILSDAASNLTVSRTGDGFPTLAMRPAVMNPSVFMKFGWAIRDGTPPGAVVLTPEMNEVAWYYSQRHIIPGVISDAEEQEVLPLAKANFPGAPIYLAFGRDGQFVVLRMSGPDKSSPFAAIP